MDLERVETLALAGKLREAARELAEAEGFEARLWATYLHNAAGRFDEALTGALEIAEQSGDGRLAARALITGASALRQLDRHLAALPLDESALRLAPDDLTRAHALIGLAADAVGVGRARECAERIDAAAALVPPGDWRTRVRLAWVRCEHALLEGRARKAVTHARDALERSIRAKARRHEAKSLLFLGFALRSAGDPEWVATLRRARDLAARIGAKPVASVAASALPVRSVAGNGGTGAASGR